MLVPAVASLMVLFIFIVILTAPTALEMELVMPEQPSLREAAMRAAVAMAICAAAVPAMMGAPSE